MRNSLNSFLENISVFTSIAVFQLFSNLMKFSNFFFTSLNTEKRLDKNFLKKFQTNSKVFMFSQKLSCLSFCTLFQLNIFCLHLTFRELYRFFKLLSVVNACQVFVVFCSLLLLSSNIIATIKTKHQDIFMMRVMTWHVSLVLLHNLLLSSIKITGIINII